MLNNIVPALKKINKLLIRIFKHFYITIQKQHFEKPWIQFMCIMIFKQIFEVV